MRAAILFGLLLPALHGQTAADLLAKARSAFARNQAQEKHWNWVALEARSLTNKAGEAIEKFPTVTAESVIRNDGRRCNAVVAWGDGRKPYRADADSDARCQAMDAFRAPISIAALLENGNASVIAPFQIAIMPDKTRLKSQDVAVRCAASIRATVRLDPGTFFPTLLEGEVVENGCDIEFQPILQYGGRRGTPAKSNFRKGSQFRIELVLQRDKLGHPENSYWIAVMQRYVQPWDSDSRMLYYWGRQIPVTAGSAAHRLIKEVRTTAKQFGAESQLHFESADQPK